MTPSKSSINVSSTLRLKRPPKINYRPLKVSKEVENVYESEDGATYRLDTKKGNLVRLGKPTSKTARRHLARSIALSLR